MIKLTISNPPGTHISGHSHLSRTTSRIVRYGCTANPRVTLPTS